MSQAEKDTRMLDPNFGKDELYPGKGQIGRYERPNGEIQGDDSKIGKGDAGRGFPTANALDDGDRGRLGFDRGYVSIPVRDQAQSNPLGPRERASNED